MYNSNENEFDLFVQRKFQEEFYWFNEQRAKQWIEQICTFSRKKNSGLFIDLIENQREKENSRFGIFPQSFFSIDVVVPSGCLNVLIERNVRLTRRSHFCFRLTIECFQTAFVRQPRTNNEPDRRCRSSVSFVLLCFKRKIRSAPNDKVITLEFSTKSRVLSK